MKKTLIASSFIILSSAALTAQAGEQSTAKKFGAFSVSTLVGTALAGPAGGLVGGLTGYYLGKELEKADQHETLSRDLYQTEKELGSLAVRLSKTEHRAKTAESKSDEYAELALEQMQLELFFDSNQGEIDEQDIVRLTKLGEYLNAHPELNIHLQGFSDPRGNKRYNQELSQRRVDSVKNSLTENGIQAERIESHSYGASQSSATKGDEFAYSQERSVKINISKADARADATALPPSMTAATSEAEL